MKIIQKSWIWKLTFPFAHNNYTAIGETIYCPNNDYPPKHVIAHETVHIFQQKRVGVLKYIFLYVFCLPLGWNPWRFKWEFEAYTMGTKISPEITRMILSSKQYGWLRNK